MERVAAGIVLVVGITNLFVCAWAVTLGGVGSRDSETCLLKSNT